MPVESRAQLKTHFETGDYPTQAQFANLIDSLLHQNDTLNGANISIGGQMLIQFLNNYFFQTIPFTQELDGVSGAVTVAGRQTVYALLLVADADMTLHIGSTPGADDVAQIDLVAGEYKWLDLRFVNQNDDQEVLLHFSNVSTFLRIATYFRNNPF